MKIITMTTIVTLFFNVSLDEVYLLSPVKCRNPLPIRKKISTNASGIPKMIPAKVSSAPNMDIVSFVLVHYRSFPILCRFPARILVLLRFATS